MSSPLAAVSHLLDTNICIYAINSRLATVPQMLSHSRGALSTSVLCEAELRFGAEKSGAPSKNLRAILRFFGGVEVLPFTSEDAIAYAAIRQKLEKAGTPIGPIDTLIAAQALSRKLTLVTNNTEEFSRVEGLKLENWA